VKPIGVRSVYIALKLASAHSSSCNVGWGEATLFQGESSIIETNPFRNNDLTQLIESSCKVGWGEAHLLLEWALDSLGTGEK
jgi:hypothetical protein